MSKFLTVKILEEAIYNKQFGIRKVILLCVFHLFIKLNITSKKLFSDNTKNNPKIHLILVVSKKMKKLSEKHE